MRRDNDYVLRINRVLDYISNHPDGDLSLDHLSRIACFSSYHFHRIFKALVGETLHGHVRRVRLERAAGLMRAAPESSLTDIALRVGFATLADFSRAFRARYGIPPSVWDRRSPMPDSKNCKAPEPFQRYREDELEGIGRREGLAVRLQEFPKSRYVYIRVHDAYGNERLVTAYRTLRDWLGRHALELRETVVVGMASDDPEVTPKERCRYDMGVAFPLYEHGGIVDHVVAARGEGRRSARWKTELADDLRSNGVGSEAFGLSVRDIEGCRVAGLHCRGDLSRVDLAWQLLYRYWLPHSPYQPANLPAMELFVRVPEEIGWESFDIECCVALDAL